MSRRKRAFFATRKSFFLHVFCSNRQIGVPQAKERRVPTFCRVQDDDEKFCRKFSNSEAVVDEEGFVVVRHQPCTDVLIE